MHKITTLIACTALTTLSCTAALAEEPVGKVWSGDVELGYVAIAGNSDETSIKGKIDINRDFDIWRYNIHLESLYTQSNNQRTAEKYFLSNRLGRNYNDTDYLFAYGSYDQDQFSGFDYQASAALGWGRKLLDDALMQWDVEVGPGYRRSQVRDDTIADDEGEAILRLFTQFHWQFTDTAQFSQSLNVESGDSTISKSDSTLKVAINDTVSLKLFYSVKYNDSVPAGSEHANTETGATITYSF